MSFCYCLKLHWTKITVKVEKSSTHQREWLWGTQNQDWQPKFSYKRMKISW